MKKSIFQELVEESIVLLKNEEQILPLKEKKVAFLGRAQIETIFSGNGSGASKSLANKNLLCECEKRGICAEAGLKQFYTSNQKNESEKFVIDGIDITNVENMNCGFMYEIFGKYQPMWTEYHIPEQLMQKAREFTDTAVFVLGRNAGGEECDRHIEGDYELTESEKELLEQVCCVFPHVIVVLNINGMIDMQWVNAYSAIKAVVFLGIPGEEGCGALADILTGAVNPSGKLSFSMAESFKDYPTAENFTWNKEQEDEILTYENYGLDAKANGSTGYTKSPVTVYQEDIYLGYRYFDTFRKLVLYPFGYGMSYTSFTILPKEMKQEKEEVEFITEVTNSGNYAGKETIQLYLSCSGTESEKPEKELKGFAKTRLLAPGEKQNISIRISMQDLAGYVETSASYILEKGKYQFFIGNSSRETIFAGEIQIREDYIIKKCVNRLCVQNCNVEHLQVLSAREGRKKVRMHEKKKEETDGLKEQERYDLLRDEMEQVKNFSIEQLAALCVGYGPGIPFAAFSKQEQPETILDDQGNPMTKNDHPVGAKGYVSPAMPEKGIHSIFYKDGPAGVGTGAWPTAMLISCAFNKELWEAFGNAVGAECEKKAVDVWLAPAVNLHRNPLCGRNFEYFSEDPYLTGICAVQITKGVQENHPVRVCPKHFAVNEQETYRRGSAKKRYDAVDSILTERALRELYLKPFEMLVRDAGVSFIMTSFNKINGVLAAGNRDLCTHILREEWNFDGVVVTDWGDMDIVADGGDAVAAGNDIVIPGGPPVIRQILQAYQERRITRKDLERSVARLLHVLKLFEKGERI